MDSIVLLFSIVFYLYYNRRFLQSRYTSEGALKLLLLYVFLYGALEYWGMPSFLKKFMIDILMALLILAQLKNRRFHYIYLDWFLFFSFIYFFISAISQSNIYESVTFYRIFLYPYLIYLVVANLKMDEYRWLNFNRFIFSLFILQIVASVFKYFFIGPLEKGLIGTVSTSGGVYSTMIPLTAIAFIISYYLFYKQDKRYILLIIGFLFMGYVGLKRGIWLYLPLVISVGLYYYSKSVNLSGVSKRLITSGFFFVLFSFLVVIVGTMYSPSLNPDSIRGGTFDGGFLQEYTMTYTFNRAEDGSVTYGRGANFQNIFNQMVKKDAITFLFGYGPEATKGVALYGEGIWGELGVAGPTPGVAQHLVAFGFAGIFLILLVVFKSLNMLLKLSRIETSFYWKAFSYGGFMVAIVFLVDYFTYASSFIATIFPLSFTCAYILGVAYHRKVLLITLYKQKNLVDNF